MFHVLTALSNLHDGYNKVFHVNGVALILLQRDGQRYLIEDRCPHMDAKLSTGTFSDEDVICRAHGIAFCLNTGSAKGPLAHTLDCLTFFPLVYDGSKIGVDL